MKAEDQDLIERFEIAYNNIDKQLREKLEDQIDATFSVLVWEYAQKFPFWKYQATLQQYGKLRNSLVHQHYKKHEYLAVPLLETVLNIEFILATLENPPLVYPDYQAEVMRLSINDNLKRIFDLIANLNYSQFPIYDDSDFIGLLTENGLSRGLAQFRQDDTIQFSDISIRDLLSKEETTNNYGFISRRTLFAEAARLFRENTKLEALFITETGRKTEGLLGIITRWDIVNPKRPA
ncbi:MAG: CBS domain-containing protein [Chloroflexi bacterium]|uniref:CBS domain-containing protein n=1 Tax=Candidatus Chlorohelix allophototropha TaxID=3003348 RepID=A0A8T7MAH9_9CHLR|nr:CBS domain-containing protein [Chloroflexota bacterium]WJW70444.1 CBS domain-containing protein [Chloroflexota bacterium L227-S17]